MLLLLTDMIYFLRDLLWGGPLIALLIGVGVYQTFRLKGFQFIYLPKLLKISLNPFQQRNKKKTVRGDVSPFQALMTALAGAIGTGNIAGIATAVVTGGVGALFWMWVVAFLGMATAYSETVLALLYRVKNSAGEISGGPMYTLQRALGAKKLAIGFAIFGAIASLGYNMVQSNSVVDAVVLYCDQERLVLGAWLAGLTAIVIIAGIRSIGRIAGVLVPFMALGYLIMSCYVLAYHYDRILHAFWLILQSAFCGQAAAGGFMGATMWMAFSNGAQFGVFANEAGLGSFAIASSAAKSTQPVEQGFMAASGVFISTMVVCTMTGLVLAVTQMVGAENETHQLLKGSQLALAAFSSVSSVFAYFLVLGLILFAFTTILAWAYYGEKCVEYLLGTSASLTFRWLYIGIILLGSTLELDVVWAFAHLANGCMALPNLLSIIVLSKELKSITIDYFQGLKNMGNNLIG